MPNCKKVYDKLIKFAKSLPTKGDLNIDLVTIKDFISSTEKIYNEKFSQNVLVALREVAEEKEQAKSQEDIYAEESIYSKFTSNKDTALFPAWHAASWKDKLKLLSKFDDQRLVGFGQKIIFQEAPEVLPFDILKKIKTGIAKRILSENKEK